MVTARVPTPQQEDIAAEAFIRVASILRDSGYRFTTPTPSTHVRVNNRPLNALAQRLEDVFGWSRPFDKQLLSPALFELMTMADIMARDGEDWRSKVRVSTLGDKLFFHSAFPTTEADAVFFGPDTYRFGDAVTHALDRRAAPIMRGVDIGCGAGPGAILMAAACPDAEVWAVDINPAALRLASINAALNGVHNVVPCHSDLLDSVEGDFDLIISNPPYLVDPGERAYRHGGGPLGADLSLAIVKTALQRLTPGGTLLLYTGVAIVNGKDLFLNAVEGLLTKSGVTWTYREVDPDVFGEELLNECYADTDRIAAVVLAATRPADLDDPA